MKYIFSLFCGLLSAVSFSQTVDTIPYRTINSDFYMSDRIQSERYYDSIVVYRLLISDSEFIDKKIICYGNDDSVCGIHFKICNHDWYICDKDGNWKLFYSHVNNSLVNVKYVTTERNIRKLNKKLKFRGQYIFLFEMVFTDNSVRSDQPEYYLFTPKYGIIGIYLNKYSTLFRNDIW